MAQLAEALASRARFIYRRRRELRWMVREERRSPYRISAAARLRAWRLGFITEHYLLYELDRDDRDPAQYVSDRARYLRLSQLNRPYSLILHDKLLFGEVFRRHPDLVPDTLAYVRRGRVMPRSEKERIDSLDALFEALHRRGKLVLKGVLGQEGSTVAVLEDESGDLRLAGEPATRDSVVRYIKSRRPQILMEYVRQAAYSRDIFPGSVNTIRMLTMTDADTGEPFLARALHRFGTASSRGVDSAVRGGVRATIEIETGLLGPGFRVTPEGRPEPIESHPETGTRITGVQIPSWRRAVDRVLEIAAAHPYLPYVGWDVVITEDGIRILEGNSNSGLDGIQRYRPLLADPRIRRFYESRGILD
jgi:hypothetical protein